MKITDLIQESNTDEEVLELLKTEFINDPKKDYNNASHKFYSVRKRLITKDERVKDVSPSEFFQYLKSNKKVAPNKPLTNLDKAKLEYKKIHNEEISGRPLEVLEEFPAGTLNGLNALIDKFKSFSDGDSATKKFFKAKDELKADKKWFHHVYFITADVFFKHLKSHFSQLRMQRQQDKFDDGDWDDKMPIDQVERIIKGRRW